MRGKAYFKNEVAARVRFDAAAMPYRAELVDWLRGEAARGRRLVLASGANVRIVEAVAAHLGIFSDTLASDEVQNLTGEAKTAALAARFGRFDYIGDATVDLPVWRTAEKAYLCASSAIRARAFGQQVTFARTFCDEPVSSLRLWLRALRLHQWVKNVLMFVPIVLAHEFMDFDRLGTLMLGFMAFNICASSVYVLNDLLDLAADRQHPRKSSRPFASGDLPLINGIAIWPVLVVSGFALAVYASPAFAGVLCVYYVLTLAYSFDLKRRALVDVFALASLYTLRIIAGAVAAAVALSPWLLGFSIFIFLSLAIVKRVAELHSVRERGIRDVVGRGYQIDDLAIRRAASSGLSPFSFSNSRRSEHECVAASAARQLGQLPA